MFSTFCWTGRIDDYASVAGSHRGHFSASTRHGQLSKVCSRYVSRMLSTHISIVFLSVCRWIEITLVGTILLSIRHTCPLIYSSTVENTLKAQIIIRVRYNLLDSVTP